MCCSHLQEFLGEADCLDATGMDTVDISRRVYAVDVKALLITQECAQITLITTHDLWWKRFQQAVWLHYRFIRLSWQCNSG